MKHAHFYFLQLKISDFVFGSQKGSFLSNFEWKFVQMYVSEHFFLAETIHVGHINMLINSMITALYLAAHSKRPIKSMEAVLIHNTSCNFSNLLIWKLLFHNTNINLKSNFHFKWSFYISFFFLFASQVKLFSTFWPIFFLLKVKAPCNGRGFSDETNMWQRSLAGCDPRTSCSDDCFFANWASMKSSCSIAQNIVSYAQTPGTDLMKFSAEYDTFEWQLLHNIYCFHLLHKDSHCLINPCSCHVTVPACPPRHFLTSRTD